MFSRQMEELKESYQEKLENTFEMYKDAIKEHAYQSAMSHLEDDYVPLDEFLAEQQRVEVCRWFHQVQSGHLDQSSCCRFHRPSDLLCRLSNVSYQSWRLEVPPGG